MDLQAWIDINRTVLTEAVNRALSQPLSTPQDDEELELWVRNDEGLYLWAKRERVEDI